MSAADVALMAIAVVALAAAAVIAVVVLVVGLRAWTASDRTYTQHTKGPRS